MRLFKRIDTLSGEGEGRGGEWEERVGEWEKGGSQKATL